MQHDVQVRLTTFVALCNQEIPYAGSALLTDTLQVTRDLSSYFGHTLGELLRRRQTIEVRAARP